MFEGALFEKQANHSLAERCGAVRCSRIKHKKLAPVCGKVWRNLSAKKHTPLRKIVYHPQKAFGVGLLCCKPTLDRLLFLSHLCVIDGMTANTFEGLQASKPLCTVHLAKASSDRPILKQLLCPLGSFPHDGLQRSHNSSIQRLQDLYRVW